MVDWRGGNDYAVLACPYYQYPKSNSQIYGQALDGNVCLLSWEHFAYFLEHNDSFHVLGNEFICKHVGTVPTALIDYLHESKQVIISRGTNEIEYWKAIITQIHKYTKEQAITELISAMKINEKISAIGKYIKRLKVTP